MPDPYLRRALAHREWDDAVEHLLFPHRRLYQTSAPFHAAMDVLAELLPAMVEGLDPLEQGALALLLPRMVAGLTAEAGYEGWAGREIARLMQEGGPVHAPEGASWPFRGTRE